MKDPPDKYRCLKVQINSVLHKEKDNDKNMEILQSAIIGTNYITIKSYMLLRLWVLEKYHSNLEIPVITEDTIKMAMKSVVVDSKGPKPKGYNLELFNEFRTLNTFELDNGVNLSSILQYYQTTMLTAIENNIKMHFTDNVKRFIASCFKIETDDKVVKKKHRVDLSVLKNDILENTLNSDSKYHTWLLENRHKIVPETYDTSYYYDISSNPQRYLKHMIFMCSKLEDNSDGLFQFFPLQTNIIPRHIQIDTKSIIDLFIPNKTQYLNNIELNKEFLWFECFNIFQTIKNYEFDHTVITDGYSISLRFLNKKYVEEQKIKKQKMKNGKREMSSLSVEEKIVRKNEKIQKDLDTKEKAKELRKKTPIKKTVKKEHLEFPYIDEIDNDQLQGKHIFIDPGKRSLFTMMNDDGNFMSYTNKERMNSTKRLKYSRMIKKYKDSEEITNKENEMTSYNSKTCSIEKFRDYSSKKIEINNALYEKYQKEKFRKYRWYSFINKKRTEDKMLNKISNKFGSDSTIIIGDWSVSKQMRNFISTPNLSLKRKLKERFKVYNIDEYRTSCLSYKTEEYCKNLYLPDLKNKTRKIHSILTYQMENKRKGCINRDKNGCKNIQKLFQSYTLTGDIPLKYRRSYRFPNE
jgi:hypothetical protein